MQDCLGVYSLRSRICNNGFHTKPDISDGVGVKVSVLAFGQLVLGTGPGFKVESLGIDLKFGPEESED